MAEGTTTASACARSCTGGTEDARGMTTNRAAVAIYRVVKRRSWRARAFHRRSRRLLLLLFFSIVFRFVYRSRTPPPRPPRVLALCIGVFMYVFAFVICTRIYAFVIIVIIIIINIITFPSIGRRGDNRRTSVRPSSAHHPIRPYVPVGNDVFAVAPMN
jgi:hypothetical protein